jgi:hypothetical protein
MVRTSFYCIDYTLSTDDRSIDYLHKGNSLSRYVKNKMESIYDAESR